MAKKRSKNKNDYSNKLMRWLQKLAEYIAVIVGLSLIITSAIIIVTSYQDLLSGSVDKAIQDGLFVLILLELFYVVRSFVKYNSVNVGLIVNVGIIAAVKEMVFQLKRLDWQLGLAFGIIFITLGVLYWMESQYYRQYKEEGQETAEEDLLLTDLAD